MGATISTIMELPSRAHFIGICGQAMGALAIELQESGVVVSGSDGNTRPPMGPLLAAAGIEVKMPYAEENLPDEETLVIAGRGAGADNLEVIAARSKGLEVLSFPEFLQRVFLHQTCNIVVAGTKGKSTTTAMLTCILESAGFSPNYLVGARSPQLERSCRFRESTIAVLEGDEYPAGFGSGTVNRGKFLFYRPTLLLVTNLFPDHPDIFATEAEQLVQYQRLIQLLQPPPGGTLDIAPAIFFGDSAACAERFSMLENVAKEQGIPVYQAGRDWQVDKIESYPGGIRYQLNGSQVNLTAKNEYDAQNSALAAMAASYLGVSTAVSAAALSGFQPLHGRSELITEVGGRALYYNATSHPDAVQAALAGLRKRYHNCPLWVMYEPQFPGSNDWYFQRRLPEVLAGADGIILLPKVDAAEEERRQSFSGELLQQDLQRRNITCFATATQSEIESRLHNLPANAVLFAALHIIDAWLVGWIKELWENKTKQRNS